MDFKENYEKEMEEEKNNSQLLKKKRSKNKIKINKIQNINNNNLLIEQEQINGKCLDQAFIYGDTTNKKFIGLQMKYLSDKINHNTLLKSINKQKIKEDCQNILLRAKFDLNIGIKEWHYFIIAYYNSDEKGNEFCRELAEHCQKFDISIIYFNPKTLKFFKRVDNQFIILPKIEISNISNLDYDFPESNPYNLINKNEIDEILNSYYKQRIQKINTNNFYKPQMLLNKYNEWLKQYNLNQKNIEESILRTLKLKTKKDFSSKEI